MNIRQILNGAIARFKKVMKDERGFLQTLLPLALSAGASYLGSKGKKGQTIDPQTFDDRNPEKKQMDAFLANYVSKYGNLYEPGKAYTGKRTADLSGLEKQGLEQFLPNYLNSPDVSPELGNVRSLLQKTINGGFDPGTSEYYRALRDTAQYNRGQAVKDTNADLGARGKYFSSEAVQKYGDINAQTANTLNTVMAQLANQERDRSAGAVSQATSLEDYIAGIPLQKATAATSLGAIPRMLEQNDLESLYQDFIRRQDEGKGVISAASGVSSARTTEGYPLPSLQKDNSQSTGQMIGEFIPLILSMLK